MLLNSDSAFRHGIFLDLFTLDTCPAITFTKILEDIVIHTVLFGLSLYTT